MPNLSLEQIFMAELQYPLNIGVYNGNSDKPLARVLLTDVSVMKAVQNRHQIAKLYFVFCKDFK